MTARRAFCIALGRRCLRIGGELAIGAHLPIRFRPLEMGSGDPSEHGPVHLDPTQIEAREISPGQIG
jgi:hypothetical protein